MPVDTVASSTGLATFPDIGTLSYNGVVFSVLQHTQIKTNVVQDDAKRTTKWVETTLTVIGYVTLLRDKTTDVVWANLRKKLTEHGQTLIYTGKGYGDLIVNLSGNKGIKDAAYGPVPKILSFKPMGGAASAQIEWEVTVHIPEVDNIFPQTVAQYNYEAAITYDDEGYSQVSIRGVLEIQATRRPSLRTIQDMVDAQRQVWTDIAFDLTKFRVVRRNFNISRDKRVMDWEFMAEELPPMDLPFGATKARGTMSVAPFRPFGGNRFILFGTVWTCTLKATYTIRKDFPPRVAALNFFSLLQFRMRSSANGAFPNLNVPANNNQQGQPGVQITLGGVQLFNLQPGAAQLPPPNAPAGGRSLALLQDMRFDEGLYLDSKTMTWEASWILFTTFRTLLEASGVWRWPRVVESPQPLAAQNAVGHIKASWVRSVEDIMGWRSWLNNQLAESADVIVDMGGGGPPPAGLRPVVPIP